MGPATGTIRLDRRCAMAKKKKAKKKKKKR